VHSPGDYECSGGDDEFDNGDAQVMATVMMTEVMTVVMAVMMISVETVVMGESSGGGGERGTDNYGDCDECGGCGDDCGSGNGRGGGVLSLTS